MREVGEGNKKKLRRSGEREGKIIRREMGQVGKLWGNDGGIRGGEVGEMMRLGGEVGEQKC